MAAPSHHDQVVTPPSSGSPAGSNTWMLTLVLFATALTWAGTHAMGVVYAARPEFPATRWIFSLGLLAAAGFVFGNVIRPVDPRVVIDWSRVAAVGAVPAAILVYCWFSLEFQIDVPVVETLLAWASPFGHGIMALLLGLGFASGMQAKA